MRQPVTIEELADLLGALTPGSEFALSGEELADLFPAVGPVIFDDAARSRAKHFAKTRGCSFKFDEAANTGTLTKDWPNKSDTGRRR
jgi:hypothetical protein